MSGPDSDSKPERPALPRDAFRPQRVAASSPEASPRPVVVTPAYDDRGAGDPAPHNALPRRHNNAEAPGRRPMRPKAERNPFEAYGERSSSRPYALRLPDAIDLVLRQLAAEERTHPLRVIDRILYDHLRRVGRLPPT
ncbi:MULTISPECIES: hypothetical protein [unclassified Bosea (in: a-proteobacteria)]|uniref:hypothetical protein n=1 Tax=unclassified Bosea (in: a-proteobacteria) TaxID=2653178 RepID=UPI000F75606C|nr:MULTISPECIES: hypothetical protein [unclassified Bosea (in: a-proteobacteria)]AZO81982.1 hypothetical protein BLM15_29745 [Bosea sp. Tri-49]MCV9937363.1 hypothetical protein [Boseaceae bacterium BT-24-1]RXT16698.1 hypothetical protein B5U98_27640 [Bosea sp. Tri-39]RXT42381.1 hypothetical protein B5U99_00280 [Bosea sp. Tri-54]